MNGEMTPRQQASEAIRQAETILLLTGQRPTVDQVASTIAFALILRKFGKKVSAIVTDQLPAGVQFLPTDQLGKDLTGLRDFIVKVSLRQAEVDKLKYTIEGGNLNVHVTPFKGGFAPADVSFDYGNYQYDLAVVLGVPSRGRLDRLFQQHQTLFEQIPIINIDFHRSNENYGAVNLIDPTAAALGEILIALSESLQAGMIDEPIATALLAGMMASTDRFTAPHTTAKTLTVAAQMMAAGAKQQQVVNALFRKSDGRGNDSRGSDPRSENRQRSERPREAAPNAQVNHESVSANPEPQSTQPIAEEAPIEELLPPSHIMPEMPAEPMANSGNEPLPQEELDRLPEAQAALDASYQAELHSSQA